MNDVSAPDYPPEDAGYQAALERDAEEIYARGLPDIEFVPGQGAAAVSYTHLTLPTNREV